MLVKVLGQKVAGCVSVSMAALLASVSIAQANDSIDDVNLDEILAEHEHLISGLLPVGPVLPTEGDYTYTRVREVVSSCNDSFLAAPENVAVSDTTEDSYMLNFPGSDELGLPAASISCGFFGETPAAHCGPFSGEFTVPGLDANVRVRKASVGGWMNGSNFVQLEAKLVSCQGTQCEEFGRAWGGDDFSFGERGICLNVVVQSGSSAGL